MSSRPRPAQPAADSREGTYSASDRPAYAWTAAAAAAVSSDACGADGIPGWGSRSAAAHCAAQLREATQYTTAAKQAVPRPAKPEAFVRSCVIVHEIVTNSAAPAAAAAASHRSHGTCADRHRHRPVTSEPTSRVGRRRILRPWPTIEVRTCVRVRSCLGETGSVPGRAALSEAADDPKARDLRLAGVDVAVF